MIYSGPVRDLMEISYDNVSLRVNKTLAGMRSGKTGIEEMKDTPNCKIKAKMGLGGKWVVTTLKTIGFVTDMFSLAANGIDAYSRIKNPNSDELYEVIVDIHDQLCDIQDSLNEVITQVKVASIQAQYVSSQRVVFESYRIVTYYLNMTESKEFNTTTEDVEFWHLEFAKWGSMLRESINFFMDGLLGGGFIGADVLETITEISGVQ